MKCAQIHPNLPAFVLGGLEPEEAAEVEDHLASCSDCRRELEELRKVNRALEAAPPPANPPSHLKDEILSQVRAEQRYLSSEDESSVAEERASSTSARSKNLRIVLSSAAAAAVVAFVAIGVFFGFLREEPPVATIQLVPTPQEAAGLEGYWGVAEIRP
jgi:anti-sigma factor RsiW